jgi:hypothetical protein
MPRDITISFTRRKRIAVAKIGDRVDQTGGDD